MGVKQNRFMPFAGQTGEKRGLGLMPADRKATISRR
jgi:hypothetical protein